MPLPLASTSICEQLASTSRVQLAQSACSAA
jgi:hypothetical protein